METVEETETTKQKARRLAAVDIAAEHIHPHSKQAVMIEAAYLRKLLRQGARL
jgi:hypothetical protein